MRIILIILAVLCAILSCLVLAAHFLRSSDLVLTGVCLAAPLLLIFRRRWSRIILQLLLLAGAVEWLWTMVSFVQVRAQMGQPVQRMVIILTSVAAFTAFSAMLVQLVPTRRPRGCDSLASSAPSTPPANG